MNTCTIQITRSSFYSDTINKRIEKRNNQIKEKLNKLLYDKETLNTIIDVVCERFNYTKYDILGHKRNRNVVIARQYIVQLALKMTGYTLTELGKKLNRDHSTIIYSRDVFEGLYKNEYKYRIVFDDIKKDLKEIFYK